MNLELLLFLLPFMFLGITKDGGEGNDSEDSETNEEGEDDSSSDDSSEESDNNSEEEDADDESETEDDEKESSFLGKEEFDLKSLDPKLQGQFKKMQAIFTKNNQRATTVIKKAEAFETLIADSELREYLEARRTGKAFSINSKNGNKNSRNQDNDEEDDDKPLTRGQMKEILKSQREEFTKSEYEVRQAEQLKKDAASFKKNHPDWQMYQDELAEVFAAHPTLTYEQAWKLINRSSEDKTSTKSKKNQNSSKPNRTQGNKGPQKKGLPTFEEAAEFAKRSLGWK